MLDRPSAWGITTHTLGSKLILKDGCERKEGGHIATFAELALATAAVSGIAPNMAPEWLKEGERITGTGQAECILFTGEISLLCT